MPILCVRVHLAKSMIVVTSLGRATEMISPSPSVEVVAIKSRSNSSELNAKLDPGGAGSHCLMELWRNAPLKKSTSFSVEVVESVFDIAYLRLLIAEKV